MDGHLPGPTDHDEMNTGGHAGDSRRSRARERQQRRKERRVFAEPVARGTSRPRQIRPAGSFQMPQIPVQYLRPLLLAVGALLFMGTVIMALGMFKNDPTESASNALWIAEDWLYNTHDDDAVRDFVRHLRRHRVGHVYAQITTLDINGEWSGRPGGTNEFEEVEGEVVAFAEQFKRLYPEGRLYGALTINSLLSQEGYRLDDPDIQQTIVDFSVRVVNQMGFDGVMLKVEPIFDGDMDYINLVRAVRDAIGAGNRLAVAVPPDWTPTEADVPVAAIIAPDTVWSREYKRRVALLQVDQIVVSAYNSYLSSAADYTEWVAYQVEAYIDAVGTFNTTSLIIGVPAFPEALPAHSVEVENMLSSLAGVRRGIQRAGENGVRLRGLAIYADWAAGDEEWSQFRTHWLNR